MRQPSSTNYRPANRFRAKKGKKMQRETHRKCSRAGKPNRREEDILAGKGKRRAAWNKHIHVPRCFLLLVASQFALYLFYSPPCLCSARVLSGIQQTLQHLSLGSSAGWPATRKKIHLAV